MPFQLALPWIVMIPMIFGSSMVSLPLFFAFFLAAVGLSAMHTYHMHKPEEEIQKTDATST